MVSFSIRESNENIGPRRVKVDIFPTFVVFFALPIGWYFSCIFIVNANETYFYVMDGQHKSQLCDHKAMMMRFYCRSPFSEAKRLEILSLMIILFH